MNGHFRPCVRPSVTLFPLCSSHRIILKFSGVITMDKGDVHLSMQKVKGDVPYFLSMSSVNFQGRTGQKHRF